MVVDNVNTKWVSGYEGLYSVTRDGTIARHLKNGNIRPLKPSQNAGGYPIVNLSKAGKGTYMVLHRVVAKMFIPNPDNLPFVDHIDENKTNLAVANLRWCTHQQNINFYRAKDGRDHNIKAAQVRKQRLNAYSVRLQETRKELNVLEKRLRLKEKELQLREKRVAKAEAVTQAKLADVEKYDGYMDTTGIKFKSIDELAEVTGKPVEVDGTTFISCGAAAKYIISEELKLGRERNKATISKELRRTLKGLRPEGKMYNRYEVSIPNSCPT